MDKRGPKVTRAVLEVFQICRDILINSSVTWQWTNPLTEGDCHKPLTTLGSLANIQEIFTKIIFPREASRSDQTRLRKAKASSQPMIGSVASVAMSTGRGGDLHVWRFVAIMPCEKCDDQIVFPKRKLQLPRSTCNVCNGPQFTVEEERTGLGGGFDERGTVEYKTPPRESSDDEFDDLGRRKKKYKMPYKKPMIAQSVPDPPSEPEEEDEEEEDDDDDGDLSKYDLWGDPDEDKKDGKEDSKPSNGNKAKEESSKVSEEKRTRSRSKDTSKKRSRRSRSSRFTMIGFYSVLFLSCRLFKLFEQLQLIAVSVSIEKEAKVRKKALKKLFKLIFKSVQVDFRNKSLKPP